MNRNSEEYHKSLSNYRAHLIKTSREYRELREGKLPSKPKYKKHRVVKLREAKS